TLGLLLLSAEAAFADEDFGRDIRPILETHCFSCHGAKAQKGKLDLQRVVEPAQVLRDLKTWQAVAAKVSAGEMPPTGKAQLGEKGRAPIARRMEGLRQQAEAAQPSDPRPSSPRRITRREYRNAVRDLLKFEPDVESYLPEGRSMSGYDNQIGQLACPP